MTTTLAIKEKVAHISEFANAPRYTVQTAQYLRDEPDGDHPFLVARATVLLAAHYARFMQLGGNSEPRPSGLCTDHRVVQIIVVHIEGDVILATKELEGTL